MITCSAVKKTIAAKMGRKLRLFSPITIKPMPPSMYNKTSPATQMAWSLVFESEFEIG
jgi:hypothetical protein